MDKIAGIAIAMRRHFENQFLIGATESDIPNWIDSMVSWISPGETLAEVHFPVFGKRCNFQGSLQRSHVVVVE